MKHLYFSPSCSFTFLICLLWSVSFVSCDEVSKRNLQKSLDASFHSGELKGYRSVYIIDSYEGTYEYDDNPGEPLLQYPIYKHDDGTYTIEYSDGEYTLHQLEEPIDLFGTGNSLLKWSFRENYSSQHYYLIEDIPHSY